jgi:hypothetical protein
VGSDAPIKDLHEKGKTATISETDVDPRLQKMALKRERMIENMKQQMDKKRGPEDSYRV